MSNEPHAHRRFSKTVLPTVGRLHPQLQDASEFFEQIATIF
jgi:hypothetical protein